LHWDTARQHARMIGTGKMIMLAVAEIRKSDVGELVLIAPQRKTKFRVAALGVLFLEVPLALLAPTKTDRSLRHDKFVCRLVVSYRLPFRIVAFAEFAGKIRGTR